MKYFLWKNKEHNFLLQNSVPYDTDDTVWLCPWNINLKKLTGYAMWKFEFFPIFSNFLYAVQQLMRQLVYTMFIISNHAFFLLSWKENFVGHQKVSKYYDHDCQKNFLLLFMFLLTAPIIENSHILTEIYFRPNLPRPNLKGFQYQIWTTVKKSKK